jgi:hypothetical protein
MTQLEKKILLDIIQRLESVSVVQWRTGYLDDWSEWAQRMRDTIRSVSPMMRTLTGSTDEITDREIMTKLEEISAILKNK